MHNNALGGSHWIEAVTQPIRPEQHGLPDGSRTWHIGVSEPIHIRMAKYAWVMRNGGRVVVDRASQSLVNAGTAVSTLLRLRDEPAHFTGHCIFSSGTTGIAKPYWTSWNHLQELWAHKPAAETLSTRPVPTLGVLAEFGSATVLNGVLPRSVGRGWSVRIFDPLEVSEELWRCDAAVVAADWSKLALDHAPRRPNDSRLRTLWFAGSTPLPDDIEALHSRNVLVRSMYGQSEIPGWFSSAVLTPELHDVVGHASEHMRISPRGTIHVFWRGRWRETNDLGYIRHNRYIATSGRAYIDNGRPSCQI